MVINNNILLNLVKTERKPKTRTKIDALAYLHLLRSCYYKFRFGRPDRMEKEPEMTTQLEAAPTLYQAVGVMTSAVADENLVRLSELGKTLKMLASVPGIPDPNCWAGLLEEARNHYRTIAARIGQ